MTKKMFFSCLLLFLFVGYGCDSKNDDSNSGANVDIHTDDPQGDTKSMWVETWQSVAEDNTVPKDFIEDVADMMRDILNFNHNDNNEKYFNKKIQDDYKLSLNTFINTQFLQNSTDHKINEGSAYWLVFCVGEADHRYSTREKSLRVSSADYKKAIKEISENLIRPGFKRVLSEEDYKHWSNIIEEEIETFEKNMLEYINEYQADILCPSFRKEKYSSPEEIKTLKEWFEKTDFPKYEESRELMVSKDKRFIANMKKFFNRAVNVCLFDMFLAEIQTDLKQNKYWGHMLWSGRSQIIRRDSFSQLIWPISIRMTPDDILNKENNWIRGE